MGEQYGDSKRIMGDDTRDNLLERARRLFGDARVRQQVAALPWRVGSAGPEIMLITSRDTGRWVLPKGWVEKGEKPWRAAQREAYEEAGVRGEVSRKPAGRYLYAKVQQIGRAKPCEVTVFPLTISRLYDSWKEKDQRQRQWFTPEDAAARVDEEELADLIRRFGLDPARAA
jgi:8-oxo-dGTP pyrophosphatase MutT (NUDIX family)